MFTLKRKSYFILLILVIFNVLLIYFALQNRYRGLLVVSILDIGQGDAIFIESPNGTKVLVDAGSGRKVLSELRSFISFFEKSIDLAVVSNPDQDHIGGFIDIFSRFNVSTMLKPGTVSKSSIFQVLNKNIVDKGIKEVVASGGMEIFLDRKHKLSLEILFPDKDVSRYDTNDGSIVAKLVYGDTSFLLTGDSPIRIEDYLIGKNKNLLNSDVLKVGHHGSRTSTGRDFVEAVSPQYAVISVGKENKYGHPHKEVIDILNNLNIPAYRTDESKKITFVSDGENLKME